MIHDDSKILSQATNFCGFRAAEAHLHASPMTAALTWSLRLDERRGARPASILSQVRHRPAVRTRVRSASGLTRGTLSDDQAIARCVVIVSPRRRSSSPSPSSSSSRATTLKPHGPAAGADEATCRSASRREMILRGTLTLGALAR